MHTTFALLLQPEDDGPAPLLGLSSGEATLLVAFVAIIGGVFAIDMFRTWRETNQWRREERKRRRQLH
jgi:hypothetical protein